MATPRVFISSTFYDLRQIRADLELFVRELGYEPILHESGGLAYGSTEKLEEYAYREVELADIVVAIVGGRFGTESQHGGRSISQEELARALKTNKQVYIFVEQSVLTEYQVFLSNRKVSGIKWRFADDVRIYEHLERLYALPNNNTIQGFETATDITGFLKLQWAGLFQRFLQDQAKRQELRALQEIQTTARTLDRLVTFLTAERSDRDEAVRTLLTSNHPLFARLRTLLDVPYPIFFRDINELHRWLVDAESFALVDPESLDDDEHHEWWRGGDYLKIHRRVFDAEHRIRPSTDEWHDDWVQYLPIPDPEPEALSDTVIVEDGLQDWDQIARAARRRAAARRSPNDAVRPKPAARRAKPKPKPAPEE